MEDQRDVAPGTHPVLRAVVGIEELLDSTVEVDPVFMSTAEKREALLGLSQASARLESLRLRVVAASADVALDDGSPNVASWMGPRTLEDPARCHRTEQLALALDRRWTKVATALASGAVNLTQAQTIVAALDRLDAADIDRDVLLMAEQELVHLAEVHDPRRLRILGRKILSVIRPDLFEDEERKRLEEEERRANARARVWFHRRGDGTVELRATIGEVAASRLKSTLDSFTSPRHNNTAAGSCPLTDPATGKKIPHDERRGLALQTLLESLDPDHLPTKAGAGTTLVITMDYDDLLRRAGAGTLPDGTRISAGEARRLACSAAIIPAVLGGASEPLDLGRMSRLFSGKQRIAMAVRDRTCRAEGCQVPAQWCEAHHAGKPWASGGRTHIAEGKLLCPWHHHRAHDETYLVKLLPNGDVRFRRRT